MNPNPYLNYVRDLKSAVATARTLQPGTLQPHPAPAKPAHTALFFAPHPDDECISGGIALRLLREAGMRVINVAVTQGSKKERQMARWHELQGACQFLGFELAATGPAGLEKVNPKTRSQDPEHWRRSVTVIADILQKTAPRVIVFPHERDWNSTHIGTHLLVMDALASLPSTFSCYLVETEFWGQMDDPNLMLELSETDVADMVAAITFHVGEIARNPYHLSLPPWMMDNVRRGGELVGGQGEAAPDFTFAVLNRVQRWSHGKASRFYSGGRLLPKTVNVATLFP